MQENWQQNTDIRKVGCLPGYEKRNVFFRDFVPRGVGKVPVGGEIFDDVPEAEQEQHPVTAVIGRPGSAFVSHYEISCVCCKIRVAVCFAFGVAQFPQEAREDVA